MIFERQGLIKIEGSESPTEAGNFAVEHDD